MSSGIDETKETHQDSSYELPSTPAELVTQAMEVVNDVIDPFIPLFGTVKKISEDLLKIYDNAKCNHKICAALIDRVEIIEQAVNRLKRHKKRNEEKFRSQPYYDAWVRVCHVLEKIKEFAKNVTQQAGWKKYVNANAINETFDKIIKEFESVCSDLQLTLAIYSDEQREQESVDVKEDIDNIGKIMDDVKGEMKLFNDTLTTLSNNVEQLRTQISRSGSSTQASNVLNEVFKAKKIEYLDLGQPDGGSDNKRGENGKILKKIYKNAIEVACKRIPVVENDVTAESQKIQTELAILDLLGKCDHIITFYGLSEVEKDSVMVFAWAEYGNLRTFYEKYILEWSLKLKLIRDIFSGLYFIHSNSILHHDVRCENILITRDKVAKISNFEMSRSVQGVSAPIRNLNDYVRWMSPEKMKGNRYTNQSETFSFGMLIWELCYEKVPYETMNVHKIQDHVKNKGREVLLLNDNKIYTKLVKIIKQAWQDDPFERPSDLQVHIKLKELYEKHVPMDASPKIHGKETSSNILSNIPRLDLNPQRIPANYHDECLPPPPPPLVINVLKPFEDGLKYHKEKKFKDAWECFNGHANLGYSTAKYWKGYYLMSGYYVRRDLKEALKYFKEAADEGVTDAQLRYAFGLLEQESHDVKIVLEYMTRAANAGNATALYNLGDIYLNGKLGVTKENEKGIELIKLAALKGQPAAIEDLSKHQINV